MSAAGLRTLAETDVVQSLPAEQVMATLQAAPFVYVPGTFNTRDVGLVPTASGAAPAIRPRFVYRSGALYGLKDDGKAVLTAKLGVKKIFDLRSVSEHKTQPDPDIEGVDVIWSQSDEFNAIANLEDFVAGEGEEGYAKMYLGVLDAYKLNFKRVLEHVRDCPDEPFLFHCTAGRDRTGVLGGLLMSLAGAAPEDVTLDFLLSRIGTEPAREELLAFAMRGTGAKSTQTPGFHNLSNLRAKCWEAFVKGVEREHGGFEQYVTKTLGFSDEDLATIKKNLAGEKA